MQNSPAHRPAGESLDCTDGRLFTWSGDQLSFYRRWARSFPRGDPGMHLPYEQAVGGRHTCHLWRFRGMPCAQGYAPEANAPPQAVVPMPAFGITWGHVSDNRSIQGPAYGLGKVAQGGGAAWEHVTYRSAQADIRHSRRHPPGRISASGITWDT